jgi:DNA-binding winged helix-turn-helix (wHTH) protein
MMNTELIPARSLEQKEALTRGAEFPGRFLRFGNFELDLQRQELFKDGLRLKVQGKVYQALLALLENPGEIVSREVLRMKLWPADTHVNYDANVNTTVNKLRQLLGDTNDRPLFIETIPRKGYSFIAKVEYANQPQPRNHRQPAGETTSGVTSSGEASSGENRPGQARLGEASAAQAAGRVDAAVESAAAAPSWYRANGLSFPAGVIILVIAAMLFGAALTLYLHKPL